MNRAERARLAAETDQVVVAGRYSVDDIEVEFGEALAGAIGATHLHEPDEPIDVAASRSGHDRTATVEVTAETTLEASERLVRQHGPEVACLNFASAKNPGGGYRGGSQAQEESLARSSALVACQESAPDFYARHRRLGHPAYTDTVLCSPAVPVFRRDSGALLKEPYQLSMITCAAPNARALLDRGWSGDLEAIFVQRGRRVIEAAISHGWTRLVLGAWGCGVFGNEPSTVARAFRSILGDPNLSDRLAVTFAIYDPRPGAPALTAFRAVFPGGHGHD
ncbi:MAG TPA: TIGR02452 family protein [Actinomycetes bacterium]|nr:TIGR02452 family protein [Actinomycetes bacterium]